MKDGFGCSREPRATNDRLRRSSQIELRMGVDLASGLPSVEAYHLTIAASAILKTYG